MTVGLVMLVKNEAAILPRLMDSVRDHIDYFTIVDTGSTDDTLEVIDRIVAGLAGQVLHHPFDGFGPSRNVALEAAEPCTDWMLCLDADETFHGYIDGLEGETDCFEAEQHNGSLRFWLPRLLRSGGFWQSRGRTHEYYVSATARPPMHTNSFYVQHHGDGADRVNKFQRDIDLLMADWEEEPNGRTAFYLGRTYQDHGMVAQAAHWYEERLKLPGWPEEAFYARYSLGQVLLDIGLPEQACGHLWRAWGEQTHRAEPLVALASYYRMTEQWQLAWLAADLAFTHCLAQPGDKQPWWSGLFLDTTATGWRAAYEQSISAFYTNHRPRGKMLEEWLLHQPLPEPFMSSVLANRAFYA